MKSIKIQLFLIMVILAVVPMLIVGLSSMFIAGGSIQSLSYNLMDNHAKDILRRTEDRLIVLEQGLAEFSTNKLTIQGVNDKNNDFDILNAFYNNLFSFLLSKPEVTRILIIRQDESVFGYNASTVLSSFVPNETYRGDIFTPQACEFIDNFTDEFAYPDFPFYISPLTNKSPSFILCRRILDPETYEPIATIVAQINFSESHSLFDNITLWPQEEIVLLRRDGTIMASSIKSMVGEKRNLISDKSESADNNKRYFDSKHIFSSVRGRYNMEIQVSVPKKIAQEINYKFLVLISIIFAVTSAMLAFSFLIIKRKFFGKLGSLSKMLKSKKLSPLQPIEGEWGSDEIGEIVESYNALTYKAREQFDNEIERLQRIKQLELSALQAQIKPHFLYNTLDVGVWYAKELHADNIQNLLIKLTQYYRLSLSSGAGFISIKDELQHALLYIEMEQLRKSRQIKILTDIDPLLDKYFINKITLQPIVENSIKHGIMAANELNDEAIISISGKIVNNAVVITVDDNGIGMDEDTLSKILSSPLNSQSEHGFGVYNVHRRITLCYGAEYGLNYQSQIAVGTSVRIKIPKIINSAGEIES